MNKIIKSIIPSSIFPILFFSIILNIFRILIWGKTSYFYLLWNIFLAFVPYLISLILFNLYKIKKINTFFLMIGFVFWLLFIPNAHYLITDFIHLDEVKHAPLLYDSFLLFSSALVGLLFGLYSLNHIENIIKDNFSVLKTKIIMSVSIFLMGFGIYLGRFLRFNSWDFFVNHISIWKELRNLFLGTNHFFNTFLYTILFSSFIYVSFEMWKKLKFDK